MTQCHKRRFYLPKDTFYNLEKEKKDRITEVLTKEFSDKAFADVNIKTIVENLSIARGSFYQYFENLYDSYFYILDNKTYDIHLLFMQTLKKNNGDISLCLDDFGYEIADIIFDDSCYNLYKNRFLHWNEYLEENRIKNHQDYNKVFDKAKEMGVDLEKVNFFRAVVHALIQRNFREKWDKDLFIEKYKIHIKWIKEGIFNASR